MDYKDLTEEELALFKKYRRDKLTTKPNSEMTDKERYEDIFRRLGTDSMKEESYYKDVPERLEDESIEDYSKRVNLYKMAREPEHLKQSGDEDDLELRTKKDVLRKFLK